jgi:hypothetical protein
MRSPGCQELTFDGYSLLVLSFFAERAEMKIGNEQRVQQGGDAKLLILNLAYEIFIEKLFARSN